MNSLSDLLLSDEINSCPNTVVAREKDIIIMPAKIICFILFTFLVIILAMI